MPRCDCGVDSGRLRTSGFESGRLRTICPACEPGEFAEAFRDPSDNKMYLGPEVYPTLYKRDADGKYHAKDELIADTVAIMQTDPDAEKQAQWRAMRAATRRTAPMTEKEIQAADNGPLGQFYRAEVEQQRREASWETAVQQAAREAATSSGQKQ